MNLRKKAESSAAAAEEKANLLGGKLSQLSESTEREKRRLHDELMQIKRESKLSTSRLSADVSFFYESDISLFEHLILFSNFQGFFCFSLRKWIADPKMLGKNLSYWKTSWKILRGNLMRLVALSTSISFPNYFQEECVLEDDLATVHIEVVSCYQVVAYWYMKLAVNILTTFCNWNKRTVAGLLCNQNHL